VDLAHSAVLHTGRTFLNHDFALRFDELVKAMIAEGTDQLSLFRQSETRSRNQGTHASNDKLESELRRKGDSVTIWVAGTTSEEQGILGMTGLGIEESEDF
jgi:hypothetical protein